MQATPLSFASTPTGPGGKVLGIATTKEKPGLEEQTSHVVVQDASTDNLPQEAADEVLMLLSPRGGDILEGGTPVNQVAHAKQVPGDTAEKKAIAATIENGIGTACMSYRPVAGRTMGLPFAIVELTNAGPRRARPSCRCLFLQLLPR